MPENSVPLALCVAAIWVAWSVHDYLQEAIFLTPGFDFPLTMALTLQSVASVLAFVQRSLSTALVHLVWRCLCVVRIHFTGL